MTSTSNPVRGWSIPRLPVRPKRKSCHRRGTRYNLSHTLRRDPGGVSLTTSTRQTKEMLRRLIYNSEIHPTCCQNQATDNGLARLSDIVVCFYSCMVVYILCKEERNTFFPSSSSSSFLSSCFCLE